MLYFLFTSQNGSLVPSDPRNKLEVVQVLRKKSIDAYPSVKPSLFLNSDGINNDFGTLFPL